MKGPGPGSVGVPGSRTSALWISVLLGSAILGVLFRLDGIGSSLWLDEFGTLWTVEGSLATVWDRAANFQGQTPFYYSFVWLALKLFGESEIALRLPSMLFGLATWGALSGGAWKLFGRRAGECAFLVAAFDPTLIHASADARPYSLAFLMLTLTIVGLVRSGVTGGRGSRGLWVTAGAGTIWAHYVFYPFVVGIVGAYLATPQFQRRYKPQVFRRDILIHLLLVSLALPQLAHLLARSDTLDWVSTGYTGGGLFIMTIPYWISLVLGGLAFRKSGEPIRSSYRAIWICALIGALSFLGLKFLGTNIIHWRYMQGGLVALLLLSAGAVAVLNRYRAVVSVLVTVLLLATVLQLNRRLYGTFTQLGFEGWRQATEALDSELKGDTLTPVLFRSGFIEEDQTPFGSPVPATRAPLRSPGRESPDWNVISLTSTWERSGREAYFAEQVLPRLDGSESFYLLARSGRYAASVMDWIESVRPGTFATRRREFGQVVLVRFERMHAPQP